MPELAEQPGTAAPAPFAASLNERPAGEPWVWVTASGLVAGLVMIVGLLGIIFWNGLEVFWPKRVVEVELRAGSEAGVLGQPRLAGELVKHQVKAVRRLRPDGSPAPEEEEYQFFVGNKDAYGFAFKYVDAAEIVRLTQPEGIMVVERMEYGNAIVYPVALTLADGTVLPETAPDFVARLQALIDEGNARREQILAIERGRIGAINRQMEQLRLEELARERAGGPAARVGDVEARRAELQQRYEVLAAEARELRARQDAARFSYRLPTGETRDQPLGALLGFHFPNRMNVVDRVGHFVHRFWTFLSTEPREANTEGGIFPAIFGTFVMTLLMSVAVTPFGVLAAIYLREYARQGVLVRGVRIAVNNLAGVPSIVFGVFGLGFFVYTVGGSIDRMFFSLSLPTPTFGTGGILWAALTLALMTVPVVIVATEEALAAVSRGVREGSLACGASKWQTIQRLVLPASAPGILTGLILAMARGAGEVAPLMLVGVVKLAPTLPLDTEFPFFHLDRKFMHLGFHIYDLGFQSPDSEAARPMVFATTFLLILLVVVLNLGAILIRNRLRKKYMASTF